jgi:hypothetical protein
MKVQLTFLALFFCLYSCNSKVSETQIKDTAKPSVQKTDTVKIIDTSTNDDVKQTLALAKASVAGEIAEIEAYVSIILDSTTSKSLKYRAFKGLHDQYPNAFTSIKDVRRSADKVEAALIRRAQLRALKERITSLSEQQAKKH